MTEFCRRCRRPVTSGVVLHLSCAQAGEQEAAVLRADVARLTSEVARLQAIVDEHV